MIELCSPIAMVSHLLRFALLCVTSFLSFSVDFMSRMLVGVFIKESRSPSNAPPQQRQNAHTETEFSDL